MSEWSLRFASVAAVCVSKTINQECHSNLRKRSQFFSRDSGLTVGYKFSGGCKFIIISNENIVLMLNYLKVKRIL